MHVLNQLLPYVRFWRIIIRGLLFARRKTMYKILKAETLAAKIHLMVVHAPRVASHCQPKTEADSILYVEQPR